MHEVLRTHVELNYRYHILRERSNPGASAFYEAIDRATGRETVLLAVETQAGIRVFDLSGQPSVLLPYTAGNPGAALPVSDDDWMLQYVDAADSYQRHPFLGDLFGPGHVRVSATAHSLGANASASATFSQPMAGAVRVYEIAADIYRELTNLDTVPYESDGQGGVISRLANSVNPQVSPAVADVLQRALWPPTQGSFANLAEFHAALQRAIYPPQAQSASPDNEGAGLLALVVFVIALGAVFLGYQLFVGNTKPDIPSATGGRGALAPVSSPLPPTATPDSVATVSAAEVLFAPLSGPTDGMLAPPAVDRPADVLAAASLADFAVEVIFVNPTVPSWDYGFAFRHDQASQFRLSVGSDSAWSLVFRQEYPGNGVAESPVASGPIINLRLGAGETNHLKLVTAGSYGLFYVNGEPVTQLALWNKADPGNLFVVSGMRGAAPPNVAYTGLTVRARR